MKKTLLAIETSCDETAVAIIEASQKQIVVKAHLILSQATLHSAFGGVFPNLAKREHARTLPTLINQAITESGILYKKGMPFTNKETIELIIGKDSILKEGMLSLLTAVPSASIDGIAVTHGPGLEPALWVGFNAARALAIAWNVPFYTINHMEGHIVAALMRKDDTDNTYTIETPPPPTLAILLSGGHTEIDFIQKNGSRERIGETLDDAVGEAYDKVARLLGFPYPGGPKIASMAEEARTQNIHSPAPLPRPMIHSGNLHMSFSGLKTAVRYAIEKHTPMTEKDTIGMAREFEDAVTEVLIRKTHMAIEQTGAESIIIGGGVSANTHLKEAFARLSKEHGIPLFVPDKTLATDNALMIAVACAFDLSEKRIKATNPKDQNNKVHGTLHTEHSIVIK